MIEHAHKTPSSKRKGAGEALPPAFGPMKEWKSALDGFFERPAKDGSSRKRITRIGIRIK